MSSSAGMILYTWGGFMTHSISLRFAILAFGIAEKGLEACAEILAAFVADTEMMV